VVGVTVQVLHRILLTLVCKTSVSRSLCSLWQGKTLEIFAPGSDIMGAQAGTKGEYVSKSGTSMASPHVTGAVALVMSQEVRSL
jgi:subtilisin family serine protease